ncbi:MAG: sulfite exporter TauE/SafE family protein [Eubacterium sp.]|nr:sulfite exporter TauE/SafE family protein [Eubacterium sp.]
MMTEILVLLICFGASVIGAVCGIGGGVIIKPLLDAVGIYDAATISFLSGCTVLSMSTYSVVRSRLGGHSQIDGKVGFPLAVGAAAGGLAGKTIFAYVKSLCGDSDRLGQIQAICLLLVTVGTLLYTLRKEHIATRHITNVLASAVIGGGLGLLSSFLGIGGGPINLVVLYYFFSMGTKAAAENSLYIIFFSQLASLLTSLVSRSVPVFGAGILLCMVAGGIFGGICGRSWNRKLKERSVELLFMGCMAAIILINIYNIVRMR